MKRINYCDLLDQYYTVEEFHVRSHISTIGVSITNAAVLLILGILYE